MEQNNVIAVGRDPAACISIATTGDNLSREWIVPPLITVVCLARERCGIQWAMARGVGDLAPIPMAR